MSERIEPGYKEERQLMRIALRDRKRFLDREVDELRNTLIGMSRRVGEQVRHATKALRSGDLDLAKQVRRDDDLIDALELQVDSKCERILALYHPVATDLRILFSAIKINNDLERIGDYAKNIAKTVPDISGHQDVVDLIRVQEMADISCGILDRAREAYERQDRNLARQLFERDRWLGNVYRDAFDFLIHQCGLHPEKGSALFQLVMAVKAYERIADHAVNIAENVVFIVEGTDVRHPQTERL